MEIRSGKVRSGSTPFKFFAVLGAIILATCISIRAQLPTATLLGVVKDSSGASVPGSMVTIRNTDTGSIRTATTESDGAYRVPGLLVGHYEVKVEHAGFKTAT